MSEGWYILDDMNNPVEASATEWSAWKKANPDKKFLARYELGDVLVSTVFLGLDHGYGDGSPVLWETLVFGGPLDQEMERYTSYEAAKQGHERWSTRVYSCAVSG